MSDEVKPVARSPRELLDPERLASLRLHKEKDLPPKLPGPQRALLFLVSLEEATATRVMARLTDTEVKTLRRVSGEVENVSPRVLNAIHQEFLVRVGEGLPPSMRGSNAYLRRLAGNAFGEGRAAQLWDDTPPNAQAAELSSLGVPLLEALLAEQRPQTKAVVLSQLPAGTSAELLDRMASEERVDLVTRIAKLKGVPQAVMAQIETSFRAYLNSFSDMQHYEIEGEATAANILKRFSNEVAEELMESLRDVAPELAEEIEKSLFKFEDLARIDARGMQQLLKEVPTDQLVMALKTASETLKEKVFGNVSKRASDLLREELELLGPVKLSDVEQAQQEVVQVALELERDGRITIVRDGGGGYV